MPLMYLLAIGTIVIFLIILTLNKTPRRFYLLFSICALPFIDIPVTSARFGSLRVFDAISYLIFFLLIKDFVLVERRPQLYKYLFGLLVITLLIGSLASEFVVTSLLSLLTVFPIFIFAKLLIDECEQNQNIQTELILLIKIIGVLSIFFLIAQVFIGLKFTFYPNLNPNTDSPDGYRYPSFFHDPQKYAQFLAMISFMYLPARTKNTSFKHVTLFIVFFYALLLTGGRSGLLGVCCGLLTLVLFLDLKSKAIVVAIIALCSIPAIIFFDSFVTFERASAFAGDYEFRYSVWKQAFDIFTKHPLVGIGNGNYEKFVQHYSMDQYFIYENEVLFFDQPESGYLKILVELGVFGFIIFILLLLFPILNGLKSFQKNKHDLTSVLHIASIVSWIIAFSSVFSLSDRRVMIILVCLLSFLIVGKESVLRNEEQS